MHFKSTVLWVFLFVLCISGCKKWEDHTSVNDPNLKVNLLEEIKSRPNLTKFVEYLQKTGLDKELSSSKSYTVWAPTNDALQALAPAIAADSAQLRLFMSNHIANQAYFTRNAQAGIRVVMLNGKRVTFLSNKFDEANITEADKYVSNGVLHLIDKIAPALPNGWELINQTTATFKQSAFILSQNFTGFDPALAIIDSISAVTGLPVYRPGTGLVSRNTFNEEVYDLKNESRLYTYFILNDVALNAEADKLKPYYKTSTTDSTANLAYYAVIKDLAVEGFYTIAQLPDTIISKFGVKVPIDKSKIVETRRLSNGVAYVMSGMNFNVRYKIPTVVIQGENPRGFFRPTGEVVSVTSTAFYRIRINPLTGLAYNDLFVYNHGISGLNILYQAPKLPTVKYKVYWMAINDTITVNVRVNPIAFNQRLAMGSRTATNFVYSSVVPLTYTEVYLGDYSQLSYGTLDMFLTAALSTTAGANSLTLDYIKLVPDIP